MFQNSGEKQAHSESQQEPEREQQAEEESASGLQEIPGIIKLL